MRARSAGVLGACLAVLGCGTRAPGDASDADAPDGNVLDGDALDGDAPDGDEVDATDAAVTFLVTLQESRGAATADRLAWASAGRPWGSELPAVEALRVGDCVLVTPGPLPLCDPPCEGGTICVADDTCEPQLQPVEAGDITVTGLKTALTLHPETEYHYYVATFSPDPVAGDVFDEGAAITATATGGNVPAFALTSSGVEELETSLACPPPLVDGGPLELRWTPSGQPGDRIRIAFQSGNHGTQFTRILCDTSDSGGLTIDAAIVTRYLADWRPFESWSATRVHEHRADASGVIVSLSIESRIGCTW